MENSNNKRCEQHLETQDEEPPSKRCKKNLFSANLSDDISEILTYDDDNNDFNADRFQLTEKLEAQKVFRRIPSGSYVSSTSSDKTRVYLRLLSNDELFQESYQYPLKSSSRPSILPNLFNEIRSKVEAERDLELQKRIAFINGETPETALQEPREEKEVKKRSSDILWVEKFKPNNFMELLSDDGTNRTLLRWLKLWDKVVFNKEVKLHLEPDSTTKSFSKSFKNQPNKFKKQQPLSQELDKSNCPVQKIALLCGPPGLGKTTLAHVIAAQAGYNAVEMNASDDRSVEIFRNQIQAATQMQAVFGEEKKPNCLIIDEIDGAPLASVNVLMSMAIGKSQENNSNKLKTAKKESKKSLLPRPIICICNNQYASSLRNLRMNALVINFPSTTSNRLASRLMEIARTEKLKTDLSTLMALCNKSENDIRSCISTLQFVTNKQRVLRMSDVNCLSCGQKDIQKSLFSLWQTLLQIPKTVRKAVVISGTGEVQLTDSEVSRFEKMLALSQCYNEHDKILQGLFENYPLVKFKEHNMKTCLYGSEWFCFADMLQEEIQHSQNYTVMPYLPFVTLALHYAFASNSYPKIIFPTAQFQMNTKVSSCKNVLTNVIDEVSPALRSHLNTTLLVLDLLPLLIHIIQPQFRPVNVQLYRTDEKALFEHVVDVMISYNINYHQQIGQEGQYNYVFEPQFDIVACFAGTKPPTTTYASKQAISHHINLEKMRREDEKRKKNESENKEKTKTVKERSKTPPPPPGKQVLQPKPVIDKPCVDFFGRVINKITVKSRKESEVEPYKGNVWFHFKEGYSNATRRKIRMKDLLK